MSECYPTGCTPCTSPIEFPEMPADGDRHCVPIGSNGEQKCWVYDKCIPGWRAEGPATSPTRYRGLINPCGTPPAEDIQAGDWYIISADKADICIQDPRWGLNLGDFKQGDRIAYNGTTWETFPPPDVPYAEEALDTTPDPDNRVGGIVKNASLADAIAGTKKCDAITPYTLKETIKNSDFIDDVLDPIIDARIGDGTITLNQNGAQVGTFTVNQTGNTTIDLTDAAGAAVPVGAIIAFAANSVPTGFVKCNGALLNKTTYADLFNVLGTTYGGDGTTTFAVPDLRASFIRGHDDGRSVDDGRVFGSEQAAELGPHSHVFEDIGGTVAHFQNKGRRLSMDIGTGQDDFGQYSMGPGNRGQKHAGLGQLAATGGTGIGEDNHPLNIALLYCIKY